MVLFVFFLTINLGNMIVAYSTLYKSDEVGFLLTHPISFEKIFIVKFLDNFFHSSSTLFVVGVAVLAGYGSVFSMPLTFYLFVMVAIVIPFMLLAAALAVTLLLALMKLATKVNARRLIMGLLIGYLALVYFYFRFTNPVQLTEEVMKFYPHVNEYFSQFDPMFVAYLPNHWVADSLYFFVRGDTSAAAPYVIVLILATLGSVLLCLLVANRLYYPTLISSRELLIDGIPNSLVPRPAGRSFVEEGFLAILSRTKPMAPSPDLVLSHRRVRDKYCDSQVEDDTSFSPDRFISHRHDLQRFLDRLRGVKVCVPHD
jgi:hypothetical protein